MQEDFEWDVLRNIAVRDLNKGSTAIMKQAAAASFAVNIEQEQESARESSRGDPPAA